MTFQRLDFSASNYPEVPGDMDMALVTLAVLLVWFLLMGGWRTA